LEQERTKKTELDGFVRLVSPPFSRLPHVQRLVAAEGRANHFLFVCGYDQKLACRLSQNGLRELPAIRRDYSTLVTRGGCLAWIIYKLRREGT
jgi:hypothetical protein